MCTFCTLKYITGTVQYHLFIGILYTGDFYLKGFFFFFQNDCDFWETISIRNEDVAEIKLQSMKNIQCLCYRFISVDILRYMYHNTRFRDNCR